MRIQGLPEHGCSRRAAWRSRPHGGAMSSSIRHNSIHRPRWLSCIREVAWRTRSHAGAGSIPSTVTQCSINKGRYNAADGVSWPCNRCSPYDPLRCRGEGTALWGLLGIPNPARLPCLVAEICGGLCQYPPGWAGLDARQLCGVQWCRSW